MSKKDDVSSSERQLFILTLLSQSSEGFTAKEILKRMERSGIECSSRTLNRDLNDISMRFNVWEDERGNQTYYIADKMAVNDITFTIPQMISLYYMRELLSDGEQTDIMKEATGIIETLLSKMPALSREALVGIGDMLKIEKSILAPSVVDPLINETIQKAISLKKSVDIIYETFHSGEVNKRCIDPYVIEIKEGKMHAIGYCHLRDEIRDFRLSRIKDAKLTRKSFDVPEGFFKEYQKNRFDKLAGNEIYDVEIEFSGDAGKLITEYHAKKADEIKTDGDRTVFKRRAAITPDFIQWILSFGSDAKVISPDILAKQIRDIVKKTIMRYEENI